MLAAPLQADDETFIVKAKRKPVNEWREYETRILSGVEGYDMSRTDTEYSRYGGLLRSKHEATGFFYTKKVGNRWFFIDPDGYLFIKKGVSATRIHTGEPYETAFAKKFGNAKNWADQTAELLREYGYNGAGGFSGDKDILLADDPLVVSPVFNLLRNYGKHNSPQGRPVRWVDDVIPVFEPELRTHMEERVANYITPEMVNDPNIVGYMSDNELGFYHAVLKNYLKQDAADPNYQGAWQWLRARKGADVTIADITEKDEEEFMGHVAEVYYKLATEIIKARDPNHLLMGTRLHGAGKRIESIYKASAKYNDVVSVNYYNSWGPDQVSNWEKWADKPFIITEWYVKGQDIADKYPEVTNFSGAGWIVPTQQDRGHFYEHFTLKLLESPINVGWHWYRYIDQFDVVDQTEVNKGMLDNKYENYPPLMDAMKRINTRAYDLIEFFDGIDLTTK